MRCPRCGGNHADSAALAVQQIAASREWARGFLFPYRHNYGVLCFLAGVLKVDVSGRPSRERLYEALVDALHSWCVRAVERARDQQQNRTDIPEPFAQAIDELLGKEKDKQL